MLFMFSLNEPRVSRNFKIKFYDVRGLCLIKIYRSKTSVINTKRLFLFRLLTIIIHVYTQFNTLSFCIDVDDSYITYLGGFKVNTSVNDFYLLMRTKHVFASSIVYSNLLQFITYFKKLVSIVFFMGRRYEENFCLILLNESYYFE